MTAVADRSPVRTAELAPGEVRDKVVKGVLTYTLGLVLAGTLTLLSFSVASTHVLWSPGVTVGLCVLGMAQMGVHLVFFLHLTSGPDNTNNILALAFGLLIVLLVGVGSLWIMSNLNMNMMDLHKMMDLHSQR